MSSIGARLGVGARRIRRRLAPSPDQSEASPVASDVCRPSLQDQVDELRHELEQLRAGSHDRAPMSLLVDSQRELSAGDAMLARVGPAVRRFLLGGTPALEVVDSDVGQLVFPAFDRFIRAHIKDHGHWEPYESDVLRSCITEGDLVVNVGANVGYTTLVLAHAVGPTGRVLAVEPSLENFAILAHNLDRNSVSNVLPVLAALGDTTGVARLSLSPDNSGDHRISENPVEIGQRQVAMLRLDDLLPPPASPALIASDAQGADLLILRGARDVIRRARPVISFEFWPSGILEMGGDLSPFDWLLAEGAAAELLLDGEQVRVESAEEAVQKVDGAGLDHATVLITWPAIVGDPATEEDGA